MLQINNYTLIVLPPDATQVEISANCGVKYWHTDKNGKADVDFIDLPPNATYTILGRVPELSVSECMELLQELLANPIKLKKLMAMPPENTWVINSLK